MHHLHQLHQQKKLCQMSSHDLHVKYQSCNWLPWIHFISWFDWASWAGRLKTWWPNIFFSFFLSLWWAKAQMFFEDLQVDLPHVWALASYLLLWLVTGKLPQPVLSMRMQRLRKHCRQLWISTSNIKMCLKCLRLPPFLAADLQR